MPHANKIQGFTLNRQKALLGWGKETGARQGYLPSIVATPRQSSCTITIVLTKEITDPFLRPIGSKARPSSQVEYLDTGSDCLHNAGMGSPGRLTNGNVSLGSITTWMVSLCTGSSHTLKQTEPGPDIGHRCRCWEIPDSVQIFREWLHRSVGLAESDEVYGMLCEPECVRVEDYPCSADENEVINRPHQWFSRSPSQWLVSSMHRTLRWKLAMISSKWRL